MSEQKLLTNVSKIAVLRLFVIFLKKLCSRNLIKEKLLLLPLVFLVKTNSESSETKREVFLRCFNKNKYLNSYKLSNFFKKIAKKKIKLIVKKKLKLFKNQIYFVNFFPFRSYKIKKAIKKSHKKTYFNFNEYYKKKSCHISKLNVDLLEWFIGFSEGDGSFVIKRTEKRILFVINQADLELMDKIRSLLGFGVVRTFKQNGRLYARYIVADQNGINKLIALFNGNIHLEKVHLLAPSSS
uniref:Putative LAGLIDADG homing endonuclease n=1 Tax=Microglena monadina TaxID=47904 RepID=A0A0S2IBN9_9CHLO|nr:putative LAGLIDADG homing endonuclease [Microglena monadina]